MHLINERIQTMKTLQRELQIFNMQPRQKKDFTDEGKS